MREDAALFRYELAIVAILKNEAPYIREWLEYHLMAGVEHFYLYDNDSEDNLTEVLKPFIDAELVDYVSMPGKVAQMLAYNHATAAHRYECRYLTFIDADEFIFPKGGRSIKEVLHDVLDDDPNAAGLAINWHMFGSGGNATADIGAGVIDRFRYRAPDKFEVEKQFGNGHVKTIANPRCIDVLTIPHFAFYYAGKHAIDENGKPVQSWFNGDVPDKKIIINHYYTKSREEYERKVVRGNADAAQNFYRMEKFYELERASTIYDDSLISYRRDRYTALRRGGGRRRGHNRTARSDRSSAVRCRPKCFNAVGVERCAE